jgi:hypothetical protein
MGLPDLAAATYLTGTLWCGCATFLGRWHDARPLALLVIGSALCLVT